MKKFFLLAIFLILPIGNTFANGINISPNEFKSKRAKIIQKSLNNTTDFKKVLIDTINNSRETLMCKMTVHHFSTVHRNNLHAISTVKEMGADLKRINFEIKQAERFTRFHLNEIDQYCN